MMVVGPKESENNAVALRDRIDGDLGHMPIDEAIVRLRKEVEDRVIRKVHKSDFDSLESEEGGANEY
jgi:threonyl-tRNA synthetase